MATKASPQWEHMVRFWVPVADDERNAPVVAVIVTNDEQFVSVPHVPLTD